MPKWLLVSMSLQTCPSPLHSQVYTQLGQTGNNQYWLKYVYVVISTVYETKTQTISRKCAESKSWPCTNERKDEEHSAIFMLQFHIHNLVFGMDQWTWTGGLGGGEFYT